MRVSLIACLICFASAVAADDVLWIDVREPDEYAAGHLEGAINIPWREIAARIRDVAPDKRMRIKLYCGVGVRSQMAKFALDAEGYERVSNEGGYDSVLAAHSACQQDKTKC
ncbi:MAG: rhodanese-like domain-containing protein [Gammaproteobacteria bacterium]|nr:rhodanese-like domain-containing protein [Gammaproteobacteria bacterium]